MDVSRFLDWLFDFYWFRSPMRAIGQIFMMLYLVLVFVVNLILYLPLQLYYLVVPSARKEPEE